MATTLERVQKIISEKLDVAVEEVTLEASIREDLDADSLDVVDLIMDLEDEFGLSISEEAAEKIATVQDIVSFVDGQKA
ncbi:acyl carrier protein [Thermoactinomyces sp. DSM 45891]|uniref:acyl carrier protein n=1 Tax=unclassified Thermoactinomyces TaxID=2634588 RepID=UPI0008993BAB|nr:MULTISPECIES: acyl carrier protein [unclassified Thermoactinomyces]SDX98543.1 acyl carrier protein [Thermoactinomyces sp. DSM 45892]SFX05486.1 acyl carrier protein [Thermoactinomyces sp. DSM 45891]